MLQSYRGGQIIQENMLAELNDYFGPSRAKTYTVGVLAEELKRTFQKDVGDDDQTQVLVT